MNCTVTEQLLLQMLFSALPSSVDVADADGPLFDGTNDDLDIIILDFLLLSAKE